MRKRRLRIGLIAAALSMFALLFFYGCHKGPGGPAAKRSPGPRIFIPPTLPPPSPVHLRPGQPTPTPTLPM